MMNLSVTARIYKLPLKERFTIARYSVSEQTTVIVAISDGVHTGFGEATVNPYYESTEAKLLTSIDVVKPIIAKAAGMHPSVLWEELSDQLTDDYFALCAVDCAYWDLYAKQRSRTLRSFFSDKKLTPKTSFTIGIDLIEQMKKNVQQHPWPVYKIKLGRANDLEVLEALRSITNSAFRVDANCAWNTQETIERSSLLKSLGVEFIEQPLPREAWDEMQPVFQLAALPIIADESCQREADVDRCHGLFHGINIKLMKCGGITPALRMINKARSLGLRIMLGCMTESSVGISNLVQLAPLVDYLDADGALLLAKDVASGVSFQDGKVCFLPSFGSGIRQLET